MTHFLIGPSIIVMGIGCMQLNLSYIFVGGMGEELMGLRGDIKELWQITKEKMTDPSVCV